jgi:hypothetical protein
MKRQSNSRITARQVRDPKESVVHTNSQGRQFSYSQIKDLLASSFAARKLQAENSLSRRSHFPQTLQPSDVNELTEFIVSLILEVGKRNNLTILNGKKKPKRNKIKKNDKIEKYLPFTDGQDTVVHFTRLEEARAISETDELLQLRSLPQQMETTRPPIPATPATHHSGMVRELDPSIRDTEKELNQAMEKIQQLQFQWEELERFRREKENARAATSDPLATTKEDLYVSDPHRLKAVEFDVDEAGAAEQEQEMEPKKLRDMCFFFFVFVFVFSFFLSLLSFQGFLFHQVD